MLWVLGLAIGVGVIVSTVRALSLEMSRKLRVTESKGLIVMNVDEASPADEAGMRRGDVLGEGNQKEVEKVDDYHAALGRVRSADSLLVLVISPGGNVMYVVLRMANRGGSLSIWGRDRVRGAYDCVDSP
jgi:S1-C subfamily serine protease